VARPHQHGSVSLESAADGKSALLAELVSRSRAGEWKGLPVVWLDFDRPKLANADFFDLMSEFARQFAMYRPVAAQRIHKFCKALELSADRHTSSTSYEGHASATSVIISLWNDYVAPALDEQSPLLLILDTYEEVLIRGEAELSKVNQWIIALVYEYQLRGLRVVFSARTLPEEGLRLDLQQENRCRYKI
jgi:hypothetical protein